MKLTEVFAHACLEWRGHSNLNKLPVLYSCCTGGFGHLVDLVCMDFIEASDKVSCDRSVGKIKLSIISS